MSYPLPPHLERSVRISWHITSWCNYSCDYCPVLVFHKRSKNGDRRNHAFDHYSAEQWLEAFETKFSEQDILLRITGGEPFLDRENFRKILLGVLAMPAWSIQIDTNGSWDPEYFRDVPKDKLGLNIAFHPQMVSFDAFYKRIRQIRDHGFHIGMLNFVLAPENLEEFRKRLEQVERDGFFVNLSPMNPTGTYLSRAKRSDEEMELIEKYNMPVDVKYKVVRPGIKDKLCYHPAISYYMLFDGRIQVHCLDDTYQNLFTDGPPPRPREAVGCRYNECIACTEMYRAIADEPLYDRPLSLYHRGEYIEEVKAFREQRRRRERLSKLPIIGSLVKPRPSLYEQLPAAVRKPDLLPVEELKPALPPTPIFGALDSTAPVQAYARDRIYLAGWAASSRFGAPLEQVRLTLNGDELGRIENFYPRPDVSVSYQRKELEQSGWRTMVWVPALGLGQYRIEVEGVAPDGTRGSLGVIPLEIVG